MTTMRIEALSGWTSEQRHVVAACFLGWTLDASDFFLLVFVLKDIAQEFNTQITEVTFAILLTLAMRPVGAYLFGRAADRWGRRPTLMVNILLYSFIEFASGFAPSLTVPITGLMHPANWARLCALNAHIDFATERCRIEAI
jgi:SHS family lactate transporter-like MFS transporter